MRPVIDPILFRARDVDRRLADAAETAGDRLFPLPLADLVKPFHRFGIRPMIVARYLFEITCVHVDIFFDDAAKVAMERRWER